MARRRLQYVIALTLIRLAAPAQTLHYLGEWRLIEAGRVQAHLGATSAHMALQTTGLAERLYPVRSDYSATYDRSLCASSTIEDAKQSGKHREVKVSYGGGKASRLERDLNLNGTVLSTREVAIPDCVHDLLAALEKLRRTVVAPGKSMTLPMSDGRRSAAVLIEAQERETIRTPAGVFTTIRHEAMLFNGVIFRRKARLFVWLTDDARRLPVQIRVQMPFYIGTVTLQLEKEEPG